MFSASSKEKIGKLGLPSKNSNNKKIKSVQILSGSPKEWNYEILYQDGTKKRGCGSEKEISKKYYKYLSDEMKNQFGKPSHSSESTTDSMSESHSESKSEKPKKKILSVEVGEKCLEREKNPRQLALTPYLHLLTFNYDNGKKKHKQLSINEIKDQYGDRLDNKTMEFLLGHQCPKAKPLNNSDVWKDDISKEKSKSEESDDECKCTIY